MTGTKRPISIIAVSVIAIFFSIFIAMPQAIFATDMPPEDLPETERLLTENPSPGTLLTDIPSRGSDEAATIEFYADSIIPASSSPFPNGVSDITLGRMPAEKDSFLVGGIYIIIGAYAMLLAVITTIILRQKKRCRPE
ncbi:MAG: hypothetical protein LBN36_08515 [Clostridiales Family XIII bacterium]|jgi:hypothetical protein|nr:hypothetical protein [Clostridiales Family XIII bacterium]